MVTARWPMFPLLSYALGGLTFLELPPPLWLRKPGAGRCRSEDTGSDDMLGAMFDIWGGGYMEPLR